MEQSIKAVLSVETFRAGMKGWVLEWSNSFGFLILGILYKGTAFGDNWNHWWGLEEEISASVEMNLNQDEPSKISIRRDELLRKGQFLVLRLVE